MTAVCVHLRLCCCVSINKFHICSFTFLSTVVTTSKKNLFLFLTSVLFSPPLPLSSFQLWLFDYLRGLSACCNLYANIKVVLNFCWINVSLTSAKRTDWVGQTMHKILQQTPIFQCINVYITNKYYLSTNVKNLLRFSFVINLSLTAVYRFKTTRIILFLYQVTNFDLL